MTAINTRVAQLEDLAAIERVKFLACRTVDDFVNDAATLDELTNLVTTDYTWTFTGPSDTANAPAAPSPAASADEFTAKLTAIAGRLTFSLQFLAGGIIDLEPGDDSASGSWVVWHPFTLDGRAWLLAGRSHDRFEREENGIWWLSETRLDASLLSPWDIDWARGSA
jgi:hypothetical protein